MLPLIANKLLLLSSKPNQRNGVGAYADLEAWPKWKALERSDRIESIDFGKSTPLSDETSVAFTPHSTAGRTPTMH